MNTRNHEDPEERTALMNYLEHLLPNRTKQPSAPPVKRRFRPSERKKESRQIQRFVAPMADPWGRYPYDKAAQARLPWKIKTTVDTDRDEKLREKILTDLQQLQIPEIDRTMHLEQRYGKKSQLGRFALHDSLSGVAFDSDFEASTGRHFQVLLMQQILRRIAPDGDLIIACNDLDFVDHFNLKRWYFYRANDWKQPNGDKLHFRVLYEEVDEAMSDRNVSVTFPDSNSQGYEQIAESLKELLAQYPYQP